MVTKLLLTILLVIGALLIARQRASARRPAPTSTTPRAPWYWRLIPAALLLVLLSVGALVFWLQWQESHRIFTVRVIDTRSGEVRTYPVYRDDVHGRAFRTIDGIDVTLADVERMEVEEGDSPGSSPR